MIITLTDEKETDYDFIFSATGSSEHVAKKIAVETGDIAVSVTELNMTRCVKQSIFGLEILVSDVDFVRKTALFPP